MEEFYLRNHHLDHSFMREWAMHRMLRRFELPYLRTRTAKLYINGDYNGTYSLMEAPDQDYVFYRNFGQGDEDSAPAVPPFAPGHALYKMKGIGTNCGNYTATFTSGGLLQWTPNQVNTFRSADPSMYAFKRGEHRQQIGKASAGAVCPQQFLRMVMRDQLSVVSAWLRSGRDCGKMVIENGLVDRDFGGSSRTDNNDGRMASFFNAYLVAKSAPPIGCENCDSDCDGNIYAAFRNTPLVDVDDFLKNFAVYAVTMGRDSPLGNGNNFFLATAGGDTEAARAYKIVQYDHNGAGTLDWSGCGIFHSVARPTAGGLSSNRLVGPLLAGPGNADNMDKYLAYVRNFSTNVYTNPDFIAEMEAHAAAIASAVEEDPWLLDRPYSTELTASAGQWEKANLLAIMEARGAEVEKQLEALDGGTFPRLDAAVPEGEICQDWRATGPVVPTAPDTTTTSCAGATTATTTTTATTSTISRVRVTTTVQEPSQAPTASPTPTNMLLRVGFLGDSIASGIKVGAGKPARILDATCRNIGTKTFAQGGTTARQWASSPIVGEMVASNDLDRIWLSVGGNDLIGAGCDAAVIPAVQLDVAAILPKLVSATGGRVPVLITGYGTPTPGGACTDAAFDLLNLAIATACGADPACTFIDATADEALGSDPRYFADSVHVNAAGYNKLFLQDGVRQWLGGCGGDGSASSFDVCVGLGGCREEMAWCPAVQAAGRSPQWGQDVDYTFDAVRDGCGLTYAHCLCSSCHSEMPGPEAESVCSPVDAASIPRTTNDVAQWTDFATVSGSTAADGSFWAEQCLAIPGDAVMLRLTIGQVIDYFAPLPGYTMCEMLRSEDKFLWSNGAVNGSFVAPAHLVGSGNYGGSAFFYPQTSVEGDARLILGVWGSTGLAGNLTGGCCSDSKSGATVGWGLPFTMSYSAGSRG